jgi:hypothetical protein
MKARKVSSMSRPRPKARFEESVEHYKGILNEMIPNAERFGSRMGLARHQAQRMKRVIDAHNRAVDDAARPGGGLVSPIHFDQMRSRANRIGAMAAAQGARVGARGDWSRAGTPQNFQVADQNPSNLDADKVDFSQLDDSQRAKAQQTADKLRTGGLEQRRKEAEVRREQDRRAQIRTAFTFE